MNYFIDFIDFREHDIDERRALHNSSIRHSGLDPESRKYLIILDTGLRRYDIIAGFM
jgi:hypothetical protein